MAFWYGVKFFEIWKKFPRLGNITVQWFTGQAFFMDA
jgi:hypothetical protein